MKRGPLAFLTGLAVLILACFGGEARPAEWQGLDKTVEKKYPGARNIGINTLVQQMEGGQEWLFLDCRSKAEYDVSRIPGAYRVETVADIAKILKDNPGQGAILYCSVGMRSGKLAQNYNEQGHDPRVFNLKRGIFGWANSGQALENEAGPTNKVHPYDNTWKRYLNRDLRAEY